MSAPQNNDAPPPKAAATLTESITSFVPWPGRSSTPKPPAEKEGAQQPTPPNVPQGGDHTISNHRHRISAALYPRDCPELHVQWYHAVDVAKRKPNYLYSGKADATKGTPKKWNPFSGGDSREIEKAFQAVADREEQTEQHRDASEASDGGDMGLRRAGSSTRPNRALDAGKGTDAEETTKVAVNEDYLFDVDVEHRELGPAYWLGPVYEVRRGTWFFTDGSTLRPCEENLATQLEEGYVKLKPWRRGSADQRAASQSRSEGGAATHNDLKRKASEGGLARQATENAQAAANEDGPPKTDIAGSTSVLTHRLFGSYMNQFVTYEDSTTAWLLTDDFMSRVSSTVYERFAGGAHFSGTKVIRGYTDLKKKAAAASKDGKRTASPSVSSGSADDKKKDPSRRKSAPPDSAELKPSLPEASADGQSSDKMPRPELSRIATLERQMSSLVSSSGAQDDARQMQEEQKREEQEIADDYRDVPGDPQDREIEHLILVTHGIGQRLGARFETFNFIHDVNELRKTLKSVYSTSPDLQALNAEVNRLPQNCRVQVLPICWRHHLDFPQQGVKLNRKEHDIADMADEEEDAYPSLQSITVEGVPALRAIIADLALDILLYQTPAYRDHIAKVVVSECNRIFDLFKQRNPYFKGKVSLAGHSLGSAVLFDVLADQAKDKPTLQPSRSKPMRKSSTRKRNRHLQFQFEVENFFCLGSPIGLFQMLKGKSIAARPNPNKVTLDGGPDSLDDFFDDTPFGSRKYRTDALSEAQFDAMVSSPKVKGLFNIFHPSDPIAYRLEPLISSAMSDLKPQPLPYTKKSFFGAPPGQGITGMPAKIGQSFSGLWSNISSGLAQNFLTRSIGLTAEDQARLELPHQNPSHAEELAKQALNVQAQAIRRSMGAGTNITAGGVISEREAAAHGAADGDVANAKQGAPNGKHPPTLLDSELETLYAGFQKSRRDSLKADGEADDYFGPAVEEKGRKLRREEGKVRALNANGRVDYSIQEGAFDISFFASVASHLAYWTDADVCHFMISQLLSRGRILRRRTISGGGV